MERRLSTILAADAVGFSAKMGESEADTLKQLSVLKTLLEEQVAAGGGRVFGRAGDGFLCEFQSPVSAVQAAFQLQRKLKGAAQRAECSLELRIGLHLADVVVQDDDLMGDGVNIAARLEGIVEPGGIVVSGTVFEQVKRAAQLSFEDLGEKDLKNISEPVRVYRVAGEMGNHSYISGNPEVLSEQSVQDVHPHAIAVLPFTNFSDDPEQEYFADGFSEDLITELARFHDLFVVSRNASFAFKDRSLDLREVGRELGVAYCLEGSVRRIGKRLRINAQLIDTHNGDHVWAEKFDCDFEEIFDVQDELTAAIVSTVVGRMERESQNAAKSKKPKDMEAYDCLLRGLEFHRLGGVTRDSAEQAVTWFTRSLEKDPDYARAHAWRSCAMSTLAREWTGEDVLEEAREEAERALELDDRDAECHRILGSINLYLRNYDKAEHHFSRACELNPNNAFIVGRTGELYNFLGDGEKALKYQERAVTLDPLLPSYCRELEAAAHYVLGNYAQTVKVVARLPRVSRRAAAYRVAALTHLNDAEALQEAKANLIEIDPSFTITAFMMGECYRDEAQRRALESDLESAGLRLE